MDESNEVHIPVAIKLMKFKSQFDREISSREVHFDPEFVIELIDQHTPTGSPACTEMPTTDATGALTKQQAEGMYCVVMPLADRNLCVALKLSLDSLK